MLFESSYPHCHLSGIILQKPKPRGDTKLPLDLRFAVFGVSSDSECISFPPTAQWPTNNVKKEALVKGAKLFHLRSFENKLLCRQVRALQEVKDIGRIATVHVLSP